MKKLLILIFSLFLMLPLFSQQKENDDLYYTAKSDTIKRENNLKQYADLYSRDTLQYNDANTDDDPFMYSDRIAMFYHGGFNPWYYNDLFYYNSFFFNDFWYDWYYPYFGFGLGWGWPWYNNFWYHPYWNHYYHNHNYWHNGHPYYDNHYAQINRRQTYSTVSNHTGLTQNAIHKSVTTSVQNRRSYQPSYNNPRMGQKPQYNNTHSFYRSSNNQIRTQRSYSVPSRSSSNYSRSYNSGASRSGSSSYSGSSHSFSGGGSFHSGSSGGGGRSGGGRR
jgi:uncharacterized membrane protein YgcG